MNKSRELFLKRAKRSAEILRYVPFIRTVGLNGSMVTGKDTSSSDIDFLIIAKSGRLYTTRFFASFLIQLTGWRRHDEKVAGRICLNCYLNSKLPDISPKRKNSRRKVAVSNKYMIALIDVFGVSERFSKSNSWMGRYQVEGRPYAQKLRKKMVPRGAKKPFRLFEPILGGRMGDILEKKLMNYQIKRIRSGKKRGDETVASINEIRLHPKK